MFGAILEWNHQRIGKQMREKHDALMKELDRYDRQYRAEEEQRYLDRWNSLTPEQQTKQKEMGRQLRHCMEYGGLPHQWKVIDRIELSYTCIACGETISDTAFLVELPKVDPACYPLGT